MKIKDLEDTVEVVRCAIKEAEKFGMTSEVMYFAMIFLQENPGESIWNAVNFGLNEWIK